MNADHYHGRDFYGHGPRGPSLLAILFITMAASLAGAFLWSLSEHAAQWKAMQIAAEQSGKINP